MTDYSKNEDYAAKDALASGDPDKLILGSDIDGELAELVTAVASKYDSSDIASQAQAIAMLDNTTLITPLRLGQALSGGAGIVADLIALADPNADRGLFWDESANAVTFFDLGTGLAFTATTLGLVLGSIDHDQLLNFSSDKHIAHSTIDINTTEGIQGGGNIAADRTLKLDISGLATATADPAADYVAFFDATDSTHKKALFTDVAGEALGDGAWYTAGQSLSAGVEATVIFGTADYDSLERGTYSTSTGIYTAGVDGARIQVTFHARVTSIAVGGTLTINGYANSTSKGYDRRQNYADGTATELSAEFVTTVVLAAGDTFTCKATASAAATLTAGQQYNRLTIVELA